MRAPRLAPVAPARAPVEAETLSPWQQAVLDELTSIRVALERQRRPSPLTRGDLAILARTLPAIVGVYGADSFTARDLVEDDRPAVRLVVQGQSVKRLAKLLARANGLAIDGLMLHRMGLEGQVTAWRILAG